MAAAGIFVLADDAATSDWNGTSKARSAPGGTIATMGARFHRNGYRERDLETRLALKIPACRGSYFPAFLEPRKTAERALVASFRRPGYISTRKVDELVQAHERHLPGIDAVQGDTRVGAFLNRRPNGPISGSTPPISRSDGGPVVSIAAIIQPDGRREILGLGLGPSEAATFWLGCNSAGSPASSS